MGKLPAGTLGDTCLRLTSLVERDFVTLAPQIGGCASYTVNLVPRKFDLLSKKKEVISDLEDNVKQVKSYISWNTSTSQYRCYSLSTHHHGLERLYSQCGLHADTCVQLEGTCHRQLKLQIYISQHSTSQNASKDIDKKKKDLFYEYHTSISYKEKRMTKIQPMCHNV